MVNTSTSAPQPTPAHILEIGMGFWASKTLLSAVELEIFTVLGDGKSAEQIAEAVGLHPRSRDDFLDALVALGMLERDGDGADAVYRNTPETALFLSKHSPAYVGGMLEMANSRLYGFWASLTTALRTGQPQSEIKDGGPSFFEALYSDPARLEQFLAAMQGIQMGSFMALAGTLDLGACSRFCDLGGANGALSAVIARAHPHLTGVTFDLPPVAPVAQRHLERMGVADRITTAEGDFFDDDYPPADVYFMGNILHDWNDDQKQLLIRKAFAGLPSGGRLVAIENVIDDARRQNAFGLLMSLNMLIEFSGASDYTGAQFDNWCRAAGFARTEIVPLVGPTSAAIAHKE
jgi:precorrin-6B methylase 2